MHKPKTGAGPTAALRRAAAFAFRLPCLRLPRAAFVAASNAPPVAVVGRPTTSTGRVETRVKLSGSPGGVGRVRSRRKRACVRASMPRAVACSRVLASWVARVRRTRVRASMPRAVACRRRLAPTAMRPKSTRAMCANQASWMRVAHAWHAWRAAYRSQASCMRVAHAWRAWRAAYRSQASRMRVAHA